MSPGADARPMGQGGRGETLGPSFADVGPSGGAVFYRWVPDAIRGPESPDNPMRPSGATWTCWGISSPLLRVIPSRSTTPPAMPRFDLYATGTALEPEATPGFAPYATG